MPYAITARYRARDGTEHVATAFMAVAGVVYGLGAPAWVMYAAIVSPCSQRCRTLSAGSAASTRGSRSHRTRQCFSANVRGTASIRVGDSDPLRRGSASACLDVRGPGEAVRTRRRLGSPARPERIGCSTEAATGRRSQRETSAAPAVATGGHRRRKGPPRRAVHGPAGSQAARPRCQPTRHRLRVSNRQMRDDVQKAAAVGRRLRPPLRNSGSEPPQAIGRLGVEVEHPGEPPVRRNTTSRTGSCAHSQRSWSSTSSIRQSSPRNGYSAVICAGIPSAAELSNRSRHTDTSDSTAGTGTTTAAWPLSDGTPPSCRAPAPDHEPVTRDVRDRRRRACLRAGRAGPDRVRGDRAGGAVRTARADQRW